VRPGEPESCESHGSAYASSRNATSGECHPDEEI
jgi:hypothetical protein